MQNLNFFDSEKITNNINTKYVVVFSVILFGLLQLQYLTGVISELFGFALPLSVLILFFILNVKKDFKIIWYYIVFMPLFIEDFPYSVYYWKPNFIFSPFNQYIAFFNVGYLYIIFSFLIIFRFFIVKRKSFFKIKILFLVLFSMMILISLTYDIFSNRSFNIYYYYMMIIFFVTGNIEINRKKANKILVSLITLSISFVIALFYRVLYGFFFSTDLLFFRVITFDSTIRNIVPLLASTLFLRNLIQTKLKIKIIFFFMISSLMAFFSMSSEVILYFLLLCFLELNYWFIIKKSYKVILLIIIVIATFTMLLLFENPFIERSISEVNSLFNFLSRDFSGSPGFRILEMININSELKHEGVLSILFGLGSKGSFSDREIRFSNEQLNPASFTEDQILNRKFENPHSLLNFILLKSGYFGLICIGLLFIYLLFLGLKTKNTSYSLLYIFSFILIYWSIKGLIFLFLINIVVSTYFNSKVKR